MLQAGQPTLDHKSLAKALEDLINVVHGLETRVLDANLLHYIFVPLSHLLKRQDVSERCTILLFNLMRLLLDRAWWKWMSPRLAEQLIILFLVSITGPPRQKPQKIISADVQVSVVHCLSALLRTRDDYPTCDLQRHFDHDEKRPFMAHLILTLLDLAEGKEHENESELRLEALDALNALWQAWLVQLDGLRAVLPGTLSTSCKIIVAGTTSHKITLSAIALALKAITRTLSDELISRLVEAPEKQTSLAKRKQTAPLGLFAGPADEEVVADRADQDEKWLKATKSQVRLALGSIAFLSKHQDTRIRSAYFELISNVLVYCFIALDNCQDLAVSTLLLAAGDHDQEIADWATDRIDHLARGPHGPDIAKRVHASMATWTSSLPRVLNAANEEHKVSVLRCLTSARRIPRLAQASQITLDSIENESRDLLNAITPHFKSKVVVKVDSVMAISQDFVESSKTTVSFLRLGSQAIEALRQMLFNFGRSQNAGDFAAVFSRYAIQDQSPIQSTAALWCLGQLLLGAEEHTACDRGVMSSRVRGILEDLIRTKDLVETKLTKETLGSDDTHEDDVFKHMTPTLLQDGHNNAMARFLSKEGKGGSRTGAREDSIKDLAQLLILRETMILQMVGSASVIIGADFRLDLIDVLYYLLQRLSDSERAVAQCAEMTLNKVAKGCQYASTDLLIIGNSDYVINAISQDLNFADASKTSHRAPFVLGAIVQLVGQEIVPVMQDVLEEVFDALDAYHGYDHICASLLAVLFTIISVIKVPNGVTLDSTIRRPVPVDVVDHDKAFQDFRQWYTTRKEDSDDIAQDEDAPDADEAAEKMNAYELTAQSVLKKCKQFLSHPSALIRQRMLQIMSKGFHVLKSNQRHLLPLLHEVWPSILHRLKTDELYVQEEAVICISTLCTLSGDFMSQRVARDVLPVFEKTIATRRKADEKTISRPSIAAVGFTSLMRFEIAVMTCVEQIIRQTPLDAALIWNLGTLFLSRLNGGNKDVEEPCQRLYRTMHQFFPDLTWIMLQGIDHDWLHKGEALRAIVTSV